MASINKIENIYNNYIRFHRWTENQTLKELAFFTPTEQQQLAIYVQIEVKSFKYVTNITAQKLRHLEKMLNIKFQIQAGYQSWVPKSERF